MMPMSDVAVATITLARGPAEEQLLLASIATLSGLGLRVAVADGGSRLEFVEALRQLPGVEVGVVPPPRNLMRQVRTALRHAQQWRPDALLYTEPDKDAFFANHLSAFLREARTPDPSGGVTVAARSARAFETFPATQQVTETALNRLCGDLTGVHTDFSYGPFLLDPGLVAYLDTLPDEVGWGWRPFMFVLAARLGQRVASVTGDFVCPGRDRAETPGDRVHRTRQLAENAAGLVRAAECPLADAGP
jgi:hypothetical protein